MVAFLISYLVGTDAVELTGTYQRDGDRIIQSWTLPAVPGRRFGPEKSVYVLTSRSTFSGGEALAFDLQRLGRAKVVGERTRGGAHPRVGIRLHPHLEATIPIARAVDPVSGGNWEGTGISPDAEVAADLALDRAYREALTTVASGKGSGTTDARAALLAASGA
jgi:C-terminal processing protease CtpA/Prc